MNERLPAVVQGAAGLVHACRRAAGARSAARGGRAATAVMLGVVDGAARRDKCRSDSQAGITLLVVYKILGRDPRTGLKGFNGFYGA